MALCVHSTARIVNIAFLLVFHLRRKQRLAMRRPARINFSFLVAQCYKLFKSGCRYNQSRETRGNQSPKKSNQRQPNRSKQEPPIVVALYIHGHNWQYYIMCREVNVQQDSETPILVYGSWPAGQTSTLLGVFKLVRFIDALRNWVVDKWLTQFVPAAGNEG